jgi:hypothetical protein
MTPERNRNSCHSVTRSLRATFIVRLLQWKKTIEREREGPKESVPCGHAYSQNGRAQAEKEICSEGTRFYDGKGIPKSNFSSTYFNLNLMLVTERLLRFKNGTTHKEFATLRQITQKRYCSSR